MKPKYWIGFVPATDDFGKVIEDEFIDGKTRMGPWALMVPVSFRLKGVGLGEGRGQLYKKQEDGKWLKIEG